MFTKNEMILKDRINSINRKTRFMIMLKKHMNKLNTKDYIKLVHIISIMY